MPTSARGPLASAVAAWIVAAVALLVLLRLASPLLIPIVIGILISYVLEPLVSWLAAHHVPRLVGATVVMLLLAGAGGWGVYTLRDDAASAAAALPEAASRARQWIASRAGAESPTGSGTDQTPPEQRPAAPADQLPSSLLSGLAGAVQTGLSSVFTLAGDIVTVFFLVFFLLVSGQRLHARVLEVAASDAPSRQRLVTILDEINMQVRRFLIVRLITAVFVGAATWLALVWMGVERAALWGILAGALNSIPYFGPVIVSGGLFLVGVFQEGGMTQALEMAGVALAITALEGWLLTPPLMGKAEGMSALTVFLGLLVWTWIWGAWGTILAVPMLVIIKAVADHTPSLRPLGRLMAP
jgi:predicted PurR-regulated permease PerM